IQARFQLTMILLHLVRTVVVSTSNAPPPTKAIKPSRRDLVFNLCASAWTYDKGNPSTEKHYQRLGQNTFWDSYCPRRDKTPSFNDSSPNYIDTAIEKALHWMSELHELLAQKGIKLSVVVYPWPAQLYHNDRHSLQVAIWESWCKSRCAHFIN